MCRNYYKDEAIQKDKNQLQVLKALLEKKEKNKQIITDLKKGQTVIEENVVEFKRRGFYKGFISLLLPCTFTEDKIDEDNFIYSNKTNDIHIIISLFHKAAKVLELKEYKTQIAKNMKEEAGASLNWIEEGIYMQNEQKITYFSFTSPVEETFVYNFIFLISKNNESVIINFNCMEHQLENWEAIGKGIMQTIEIS